MGVVTITWHIPAQQPANISLKTVSLLLATRRRGFKTQTCHCTTVWCALNSNAHPPVAAELMAEKVICGKFDGLLWSNQGEIHRCACKNTANDQHVSGTQTSASCERGQKVS